MAGATRNLTRRSTDGVDQVDAEGLCVALFRQHTSRALDPQLHTHAVIWAKVQDATGTWLALDARFLIEAQYSMSWIYDAQLRAELTRRLGVDWQPREPGHGQADIAGMPSGLLETFSQRTRQVATKFRELVTRWRNENDGAEPDARDLRARTALAVLIVVVLEIGFHPINKLRRWLLSRKRPSVGDTVYSYERAAEVMYGSLTRRDLERNFSRKQIHRFLELRDEFRDQNVWYSPNSDGLVRGLSSRQFRQLLRHRGLHLSGKDLATLEQAEAVYVQELGLIR